MRDHKDVIEHDQFIESQPSIVQVKGTCGKKKKKKNIFREDVMC